MQSSIHNPAPERQTPNNGGSRLRTVVGNRYPRKCASCHETIPVGPEVKSVVDFGAPKPYPAYHAEHSPDAGTWKGNGGKGATPQPTPTSGGNGHGVGFTPASALPPPAAPPTPPAPPRASSSPPPLALLASAGNADATPNQAAGVPWATASLTFNAGSFESARAGLADYAQPGETCEQLRARINRLVLEDLERSVRAMRELHERLGDVTPRTLSPGLRAGAPAGASAASSSPPRMITPSATPTVEGAGARPSPQGAPVGSGLPGAPAQTLPDGRPLKGLVYDVRLELSDASPLRLSRKEKVWVDWLQKRGYSSLRDVRVGDEWGLGKVLDEFEVINRSGGP